MCLSDRSLGWLSSLPRQRNRMFRAHLDAFCAGAACIGKFDEGLLAAMSPCFDATFEAESFAHARWQDANF